VASAKNKAVRVMDLYILLCICINRIFATTCLPNWTVYIVLCHIPTNEITCFSSASQRRIHADGQVISFTVEVMHVVYTLNQTSNAFGSVHLA